jgi:hypothetical protein
LRFALFNDISLTYQKKKKKIALPHQRMRAPESEHLGVCVALLFAIF